MGGLPAGRAIILALPACIYHSTARATGVGHARPPCLMRASR